MSADRDHHLRELGKHLQGMQSARLKAAKLHDDVHEQLVLMMQHGTSAGNHLKALMEDGSDSELSARPVSRPGETGAEYSARMRGWLERQAAIASMSYRRH